MVFYQLKADTEYRGLCWGDDESSALDFSRQFWTGRWITPWRPPLIRFFTFEEEAEMEGAVAAKQMFARGMSDCPFYSAAVLMFSPRAYDGLYDLFVDGGQWLPIEVTDPEGEFPQTTFYAFNCTNTLIDALDTTRSIIEYFEDLVPPRPRMIKKYVFDPQNIGDWNVFRMEWPPPFAIYVSQNVVDRIEHLKLRGLLSIKLGE